MRNSVAGLQVTKDQQSTDNGSEKVFDYLQTSFLSEPDGGV